MMMRIYAFRHSVCIYIYIYVGVSILIWVSVSIISVCGCLRIGAYRKWNMHKDPPTSGTSGGVTVNKLD